MLLFHLILLYWQQNKFYYWPKRKQTKKQRYKRTWGPESTPFGWPKPHRNCQSETGPWPIDPDTRLEFYPFQTRGMHFFIEIWMRKPYATTYWLISWGGMCQLRKAIYGLKQSPPGLKGLVRSWKNISILFMNDKEDYYCLGGMLVVSLQETIWRK